MSVRILCACEESQAVTSELRKMGIEAYSCDLLPTSGKHPEWHIQADAMEVCKIEWDAVFAFPPCTHLATSGARYFEQKKKDGRQQRGIGFFLYFTQLNHIKYTAIENPVGIMSTEYRKPDQIIQPYMFGEYQQKSTCLWLKNLPLLRETNNVYDKMMKLPKSEWNKNNDLPPGPYRAMIRSKTFPGIAKAMAQQWGAYILEKEGQNGLS